MIAIDIPGFASLELHHLVLDFNGTLAVDGTLMPGVAGALRSLARNLQLHVVTADTFGRAKQELAGLPVELTVAPPTAQADAKLRYIEALDAATVVAIGNGRNDQKMLQTAALSIALIQREGGAAQTLACADVVCADILDALHLLEQPSRLIATLRN